MGHMCTTSDSSCIAPSRSILRMRLNRVQAESLLDQKSRTTMIASPLRVQMARSRIVQALALLLVLALYSVQASLYQLPPFDTVHVGPLVGDEATVLLLPSLDGAFSLNATQSGVAYSVSDSTLKLNQVSSLPNLLDDLLHVDDEDDPVQTGLIVVEMGGPLLGVLSDTTNDVVVGDRFSSPGFAATLTSTGKLVVLGISTPSTTLWNTGYAAYLSFRVHYMLSKHLGRIICNNFDLGHMLRYPSAVALLCSLSTISAVNLVAACLDQGCICDLSLLMFCCAEAAISLLGARTTLIVSLTSFDLMRVALVAF